MILLIIPIVGIIGFLTFQGEMMSIMDTVHTSIFMFVYADELEKMKPFVHGFFELQQTISLPYAIQNAERLDESINDLEFVKKFCDKKISTFDLAHEQDPYKKLQEICPPLRGIHYSKVVELVGWPALLR